MEFHYTFTTSYLAAFAMGLFSSLHCIGMCGSIIGSLTLSLKPEIRSNKKKLLSYIFSYNLGRITSYSTAGFLVGFIQAIIILPFGLEHGYRILQLFSAVVMVCAGLYLAGWFPRFAYIEKVGGKLWKLIEPFGRRLIPVSSRTQAYLFGMVWGWLPCGLVYAALALAATTGDPYRASLTMLAFGLGTLPSVLGIGIMTNLLTKLSQMQRFKQITGSLLILIAIFALFPELNPLRLQHI
ncbi:MAG: sulfite exporter TauE/SafE family protein [Methylococcales bacterium]